MYITTKGVSVKTVISTLDLSQTPISYINLNRKRHAKQKLHQLRMFSLKCSPLGRAGAAAAPPPPFIDSRASRKDSI